MFLPLTSGGTLCLPESRDRKDIWHWLEREQVTILHSVPSLISSWLSFASCRAMRSPRCDTYSSPAVLSRSDLIQKWRAILPRSGTLVNLYGTTETPQGRTFYKCRKLTV